MLRSSPTVSNSNFELIYIKTYELQRYYEEWNSPATASKLDGITGNVCSDHEMLCLTTF